MLRAVKIRLYPNKEQTLMFFSMPKVQQKCGM